ncbi:MAG TPA: hypothetical protein VK753_08900 [Xanthomonadaceae bacterium]|jgi:hypothetical protein|nr:hypothetical protein [Xanthomonadaceae bacterium]
MNIFRTIASKAHGIRGNADHPVAETRPEPAPQAQRTPSPANDGPTKADEMMRFMAERRKRFKKL